MYPGRHVQPWLPSAFKVHTCSHFEFVSQATLLGQFLSSAKLITPLIGPKVTAFLYVSNNYLFQKGLGSMISLRNVRTLRFIKESMTSAVEISLTFSVWTVVLAVTHSLACDAGRVVAVSAAGQGPGSAECGCLVHGTRELQLWVTRDHAVALILPGRAVLHPVTHPGFLQH